MQAEIIEQIKSFFTQTVPDYIKETKATQLILSLDKEILYEFGEEIHKKETLRIMVEDLKKFDLLALLLDGKLRFNKVSTIEKNGSTYSIYTYSIFKNSSTMRVIFLYPTSSIPYEDNFKNLNQFVLDYFTNIPRPKDSQVHEIYPEFSYNIMKQIEKCFSSKEEKGVLSHFYVQDLKFYFKHMGEQYSLDVHAEIKNEIMRFLKQKDLFFRLNQNSYITYSHNCSIETVQARYKHVHFELNTLVIQFDLKFYEIDFKNYKKQTFWDSLLSHHKVFIG